MSQSGVLAPISGCCLSAACLPRFLTHCSVMYEEAVGIVIRYMSASPIVYSCLHFDKSVFLCQPNFTEITKLLQR